MTGKAHARDIFVVAHSGGFGSISVQERGWWMVASGGNGLISNYALNTATRDASPFHPHTRKTPNHRHVRNQLSRPP